MRWYNENLLELVELYAEEMGGISSEDELSDIFDSEHEEILDSLRDDQVAINEMFNNWADALCKDGEIHPEQYSTYEYVGLYSDD